MSEPVDRLKAALGPRYAIGRDLGASIVATVDVADASAYGARVALEVTCWLGCRRGGC